MTMTLQDAIAEVNSSQAEVGLIVLDDDAPVGEAIRVVTEAVASGDLIPKADHAMAVALALRNARETCAAKILGYRDEFGAGWDACVDDCVDDILALAPADALAEVQKLKADQDAAREALMNAGIALHVAKREAMAAEAEVERLRDFIKGIASRSHAALATPEKDAAP